MFPGRDQEELRRSSAGRHAAGETRADAGRDSACCAKRRHSAAIVEMHVSVLHGGITRVLPRHHSATSLMQAVRQTCIRPPAVLKIEPGTFYLSSGCCMIPRSRFLPSETISHFSAERRRYAYGDCARDSSLQRVNRRRATFNFLAIRRARKHRFGCLNCWKMERSRRMSSIACFLDFCACERYIFLGLCRQRAAAAPSIRRVASSSRRRAFRGSRVHRGSAPFG